VIAALVVVGLCVLGGLYVVAPIRRGAGRWSAPKGNDIEARKDSALSALLELEEERALGKLSDEDFVALRARYEDEAIALIKESEIARVDADDPLEREIAALRDKLACPRCGALRDTEGTCPQCGA